MILPDANLLVYAYNEGAAIDIGRVARSVAAGGGRPRLSPTVRETRDVLLST